MKIIDNFLEEKQFKQIQEIMLGPDFPWYYQNHSTYKGDTVSQLTHIFYNFELKRKSNGETIDLLDPIIQKLNAAALLRIKANLTFPAKMKERPHTDFGWNNVMTAVYYLNTNNGGTRVEDKIVQSKENRMLIMPAHTLHSVVRHTDSNYGRFVINFNYFKTIGNGEGIVKK